MIKSAVIKTSGYAIFTVALCLAMGVVPSIIGMLLRWLSPAWKSTSGNAF
ncbi:hypothetical protein [Sphingobium mellinum]